MRRSDTSEMKLDLWISTVQRSACGMNRVEIWEKTACFVSRPFTLSLISILATFSSTPVLQFFLYSSPEHRNAR